MSPHDLRLFTLIDDPARALRLLQGGRAPSAPQTLTGTLAPAGTPASAASRSADGEQ